MRYNIGREHGSSRTTRDPAGGAGRDPAQTDNRLALSETAYDELGRAWQTTTHEIDASDGSDDDSLQALTWYDKAGRVIKQDGPQLTKAFYDRLGRPTHSFVLAAAEDDGGDPETTYAEAQDVEYDIVLEERQTVYESNESDNVVMAAVIERYHDDFGGSETPGALDTNADGGTPDPLVVTAADLHGRAQITAHWYDRLDRLTDTVEFGTYGGVTFDRADSQFNDPPDRSDTALRTTYLYNLQGLLDTVEHPKEVGDPPVPLKTRYEYDAAGRQTKLIENFVDGAPSDDSDQTIIHGYTHGLMTSMTAALPDDDEQVTTYTYGVSTADHSTIDVQHLLHEIEYPDGEAVLFDYNARGEVIWTQDQEGNVIETDYDLMGREAARRVTNLASGFDNAVLRIETSYDDLGRVHKVTQYDAASGGAVVDQVKQLYDGWGNLVTFSQDRDSLVGDSGIEQYDVSYTFAKATGGRNTLRRTGMTLPDSTSVTYLYSSTGDLHDDDASRVTQVKVGTVEVAQYDYVGLDRLVGTSYPEPDDTFAWVLYGSSSGSYPGLDRFNRIGSCTWSKDIGTPLDFYDVDISYDRNSNITATVDNIFTESGNTFFDVTYTLDDLDRR